MYVCSTWQKGEMDSKNVMRRETVLTIIHAERGIDSVARRDLT